VVLITAKKPGVRDRFAVFAQLGSGLGPGASLGDGTVVKWQRSSEIVSGFLTGEHSLATQGILGSEGITLGSEQSVLDAELEIWTALVLRNKLDAFH